MKIYSIIFFMLILLQGCHNNVVHPHTISYPDKNQTTLASETDSDDFEEEYNDETIESQDDPFSTYNHFMTSFNDKLFIYVINPVSKGYASVFPEAVRISVSNVIHNIQFPIRFTNTLLQGKFHYSLDELERFVVNTTVGMGGIFDIATEHMHIPAHQEDFGQTLGYYGVGAGYHIVLPFIGPSNMRDIVGLTVDSYTSPLIYQDELKKYKIPHNYLQSAAIYSLEKINQNALHLGAYESLKKDAMDLYPFLRNIYEQKRTSDIEE